MKNQLESKNKERVVALLKAIFRNLRRVTKKNTIKLSHGIWSPNRALKAVSPA